MKFFKTSQIPSLDQATILLESIRSIDLMERAVSVKDMIHGLAPQICLTPSDLIMK